MAMDVKGYEALAEALERAYDQSARGKGLARHGNGLPFIEQPILEIARMTGVGGHIYQIMKKAQEAKGMADRNDPAAAVGELCGVIVYAAAAMTYLQELAAPFKVMEEAEVYDTKRAMAGVPNNPEGAMRDRLSDGLKEFKASMERAGNGGSR